MALKLNRKAYEYAQELIKGGLEVEIHDCDWAAHRATPDELHKFIENHNIKEYAQWFLAEDESLPEESLARYQLPFGDLKIVHKSAIAQAHEKAEAEGAQDIAQAAKKLIEMIAHVKR